MKYIHCGIIQLNRVQTQIHQGLLSKLFSVKSLAHKIEVILMANWCSNWLTVRGQPYAIKKFKDGLPLLPDHWGEKKETS
jgi:hypothetical protein